MMVESRDPAEHGSDRRCGFVLVDKPTGVSSFDVVARVRKRLGVRQVGHTGTLDPLASGLLPILVGEATKLTPHLMGLDKVYEATVRLGAATDTYDAEGRVTAEADPSGITEQAVRAAMVAFVGHISQRPPIYSAIKKNGKRLYELARSGAADDLVVEARNVIVFAMDLLGVAGFDLRFRIHCGKGTYIRSLAHDLGVALGVHAHLLGLRRTVVGPFRVEDATDVFADSPLDLEPMEQAVAHIPSVTIDAEMERRLRMGQQAALEALVVPLNTLGALRLTDGDGHLVAMAETSGPAMGRVSLARVFQRAASATSAPSATSAVSPDRGPSL